MVEAQVAFSVVAHASRLERAEDLAERLGATLCVDEGAVGPNANHDAAWAMAPSARWTVVLEDDAVLADGFEDFIPQLLTQLPWRGAVSLYLGTERPPQIQASVATALRRADVGGAGWLRSRRAWWGVALALRSDMVPDMLGFVAKSSAPYDERFSQWLLARRIPCWYPVPSPVDHADLPTLIQHRDGAPRDRPRVAWRHGQPTGVPRFVSF